MTPARGVRLLAALGLALVTATASFAREVPPLRGRVVDDADLLGPGAERTLTAKLRAYEEQTEHQYALLTIPSLEGDPIEDFGIRVVEAWQLGDAERDDGLLLIVASEERRLRIEVGYGLEGAIPDALASRVIREVIAPAFRRGDTEGGLVRAFDLLMKAGAGEAVKLPGRGGGGGLVEPGWQSWLLFFAIVAGLHFLNRLAPSRRMRGGVPPIWIGGGRRHRGGGGFGGGFGGGGFGGGGGGFGGGGASGGW